MASNVWNVTVVLLILVVISFVCYRYFDTADQQLQPREFDKRELVTQQIQQEQQQQQQEEKVAQQQTAGPVDKDQQPKKENSSFISLVCDFSKISAALPTGDLIMNKEACTMEDFTSALAKLETDHPGPHYVLFTAGLDPQTNEPWCPDCRRSLSIIRQSVAETGGTLLEIMVGDRTTWKSPSHPFRHDPMLKLTGIPTLTRWQGGKPVARTGSELERSRDQAEAKEVVDKFVADTKAAVEQ